jgi:hypothetical protein
MGAHRISTGGASALPFALISDAIPKLSRDALEGLVEDLIDRLDLADGDPEIEPNGDELDGSGTAEDDYHPGCDRHRPGCPISDPPEEDDEDYCLSSEDRGSSYMPNANFPGRQLFKEFESDPDCERWHQPVHLP